MNSNKLNLCCKTFRCIETKEHVKIHHEKAKLYCHYFDNKKIYPYDEEFVFLHTGTPACKYGAVCKCMMCMFRHEYGDVDTSGTVKKEMGKIQRRC
jgi:hypothetical protein